MHLVELSDAATFLNRSRTLLLSAEAENNLLLSSAMTLARSSSGRVPNLSFFICESNGETIGSALNAHGKRLLISQSSNEASAFMGAEFSRRNISIQGLFGPTKAVTSFQENWRPPAEQSHSKHLILRLTNLRDHRPASGLWRQAKEKDLKTVLKWSFDFVKESRMDEPKKETEEIVHRYLENRQLLVWEDSKLVAMAGFGGLTPNGARISMVYTEPSARSRGYGKSLVHALSRKVLASDRKHCFLFVESSNLVAIKVYETLGYETVGELTETRLGRN